MEWYNKSTEETIKQVQVTEYITESDRLERQQKYGRNKMEEKDQTPEWQKFLSYFHDALMYILLGAAILKVATGALMEGGMIFLVVF